MQFEILKDDGNEIRARMVLDSPRSLPKIVVSSPGREEVEIEANILRETLIDRTSVRYAAKFRVNQKNFPGFDEKDHIEIHDAKTGILLFRRFDPEQHVDAKLFRYSLQAMPEKRFDEAMGRRFNMSYHAVERFPYETMLDLIRSPSARSVYMSGRPPIGGYLQVLKASGFKIVTLLCDPYEELAERILFLSYVVNSRNVAEFTDYLTDLRPLLKAAKAFEVGDAGFNVDIFGALNEGQRQRLSNPLTRVLACEVGEAPRRQHIAIALNNLSLMDIVGLRTRSDDFKLSLHELVDVDLEDYHPSNVAWVSKVAAELSRLDEATKLLSLDLELYAYAKEAIGKALDAA